MIRSFLIAGIFLLIPAASFSQNKYVPFVTPGISFGYTFGAKANWGFTLDAGYMKQTPAGEQRYGLSFYQYFVKVKKHTHRLRSFSVMYQNNFLDAKVGIGRAKNPWGYSKRNKCIVHGLALDISARYPSMYSPWVGYRLFKYPPASWAWFFTPYNSVYTKYKYDVLPVPTLTTVKE